PLRASFMNRILVRRRSYCAMPVLLVCVGIVASAEVGHAQQRERTPAGPPQKVVVGTFGAEIARKFTVEHGLPSDRVTAITVTSDGRVLAGTDYGAAVFENDRWRKVTDYDGPVPA